VVENGIETVSVEEDGIVTMKTINGQVVALIDPPPPSPPAPPPTSSPAMVQSDLGATARRSSRDSISDPDTKQVNRASLPVSNRAPPDSLRDLSPGGRPSAVHRDSHVEASVTENGRVVRGGSIHNGRVVGGGAAQNSRSEVSCEVQQRATTDKRQVAQSAFRDQRTTLEDQQTEEQLDKQLKSLVIDDPLLTTRTSLGNNRNTSTTTTTQQQQQLMNKRDPLTAFVNNIDDPLRTFTHIQDPLRAFTKLSSSVAHVDRRQ